LGGTILAWLDPDPLTQLISDPIRIRTGFFPLRDVYFALPCCGSSTGQTRIGSDPDLISDPGPTYSLAVIHKFEAHYDVFNVTKDESYGFNNQHYPLPTDVFPIFFEVAQIH
jgi:hypothetical protein